MVRPPSLKAPSDWGSGAASFSLTLSARPRSAAGVATSWTVSKPARTGVWTPELGLDSSVSLSAEGWVSIGLTEGLACKTLMAGKSGSGFGEARPDLVEFGGGDRKRGETGQRGLSLKSAEGTPFFCGVEVGGASLATGGNEGAAEVDRLRVDAVCVGIWDREGRVGLSSCWLFLRERVPERRLEDVALRIKRPGEPSREAFGVVPLELAAEDALEAGWATPFVTGAAATAAEEAGTAMREGGLLLLAGWAAGVEGAGPGAPSEAAGGLSMAGTSVCYDAADDCSRCMPMGRSAARGCGRRRGFSG